MVGIGVADRMASSAVSQKLAVGGAESPKPAAVARTR